MHYSRELEQQLKVERRRSTVFMSNSLGLGFDRLRNKFSKLRKLVEVQVRTTSVTPKDNAQENNANSEGQFIEAEVAVPTSRGRGRPPRGIKIVE
ncbi:hypothetical protein Tco_0704065 [Tanacetum coccineum]|uniref:Uncharacterized protein n=1 Tax=Tanacetum coccineum TaxID=301880 RepID=A0ABQ4Y139_9ASTR